MVLRSTVREDICLSFEWCARELMCVCACEYLCKYGNPFAQVFTRAHTHHRLVTDSPNLHFPWPHVLFEKSTGSIICSECSSNGYS